jgi:hypothetical protein
VPCRGRHFDQYSIYQPKGSGNQVGEYPRLYLQLYDDDLARSLIRYRAYLRVVERLGSLNIAEGNILTALLYHLDSPLGAINYFQ